MSGTFSKLKKTSVKPIDQSRKRDRHRRSGDQAQVPLLEDVEQEPAAKRGRKKRTVEKTDVNYDEDQIQPELENIRNIESLDLLF